MGREARCAQLDLRARKKLPLVRQIEVSECALACLAMIAGYHGDHASLSTLRLRFAVSSRGTKLSELVRWSSALGLSSRALRLEPEDVRNLETPCILHWDTDHFVVLARVRGRHVWIHDPASGERKLTIGQLGRHFTGVALELAPTSAFTRSNPPRPISIRSLAGSISGLGRALAHVIGLALVLEIIAILMPQFMKIVVDQVLTDGDTDLLSLLGMSFILLLIMQITISSIRTWTMIWLGAKFNLSWSGNVVRHLLRLPQSYFLKRRLGDLVSRFNAISSIQQTLTTQLVSAIIDGAMAVVTVTILCLYSTKLAAIVIGGAALYTGCRIAYYHVLRESNLNQIALAAKQQGTFVESIKGVQTLRVNNATETQAARYLNCATDTMSASVTIQRLNLLFTSAGSLTAGLQRICVLWFGAWLAMRQELSAGMLMAFAAYADQFTSRCTGLIEYVTQLRLLRIQADRLADIVLTPPESHLEGNFTGVGLESEPSLSFSRVSFRYTDNDPWLLQNCTFRIEPGQSVAIIGPSGCGKSTLVRALVGAIDPVFGEVLVGGIDIRLLGKIQYRGIVGAVLQDDTLFSGSIAQNISMFDEEVSVEKLDDATRLADMHEEIMKMPMGYNTLVGDMGSSLSGGQQQRILIARALYRKPKILVLDEATSHLDVVSERRVSDILRKMSITRVIVAHRPETVATADRVLRFSNGGLHEVELHKPVAEKPK